MDPSARSTVAAPSPDPSMQSPPSLSRSTLTDPSPNQASVQHGQLKQLKPQLQLLQQQPQLQQRQLVDPTHPQGIFHQRIILKSIQMIITRRGCWKLMQAPWFI